MLHSSFPLGVCLHVVVYTRGFPRWLSGKESTCKAGDVGSIPGSGGSLGGGQGNPFQYSHLQNPGDRGAWWTAVHTVAKSWTQLKRMSTHAVYMCQSLIIRFTPPCPHCVRMSALCICVIIPALRTSLSVIELSD